MPRVRKTNAGEGGERRRLGQLPGLPTVHGKNDMAVGPDGDDGLANYLGIEEQGPAGEEGRRVGRRVGCRAQRRDQ